MRIKKVKNLKIVLSAGGNPTAIFFVSSEEDRSKYKRIASAFMEANPKVEQVGFLEDFKHLEMSGGEFCGNASRAAALLISKEKNQKTGTFTVSGYEDKVRYSVAEKEEVTCKFPNFNFRVLEVEWNKTRAILVDMDGIVHVVLPMTEKFPKKRADYEVAHNKILRALKLKDRNAVGVIWQENIDENLVRIHPVVWVKSIGSFFYETACGSGTLAVLLSHDLDKMKVVQPSGQEIEAERRSDNSLVLKSKMEVL
jgi:diaminopimelate epimerase